MSAAMRREVSAAQILRDLAIPLTLIAACGLVKGSTWDELHSLPQNWDGGFLSQSTCGPPCFGGAVPGVTTEAEAFQIIDREAGFVGCDLEDRPNQGRWISCQGVIIEIDRTSRVISGLGYRTLRRITLGDAIELYGEPDSVRLFPDGVPEAPYVVMAVYFNAIMTGLQLERSEGVIYRPRESSRVDLIEYHSLPNGGLDDAQIVEWHGFTEYGFAEEER